MISSLLYAPRLGIRPATFGVRDDARPAARRARATEEALPELSSGRWWCSDVGVGGRPGSGAVRPRETPDPERLSSHSALRPGCGGPSWGLGAGVSPGPRRAAPHSTRTPCSGLGHLSAVQPEAGADTGASLAQVAANPKAGNTPDRSSRRDGSSGSHCHVPVCAAFCSCGKNTFMKR